MLHSARDVDGVGRFVIRVDEVASSPCSALKTAGAGERVGAAGAGQSTSAGYEVRRVDALERRAPSILRQIVIEEAESGAQPGEYAIPRRGANCLR